MKKLIFLLLVFVLSISVNIVCAEPVSISSQAYICNDTGVVNVIFTGTNDGSLSGELVVYRVSDSSIMQRIKVEDMFHPPDTKLSLEFVDLNDDGYMDMIFWNSRTGTAGAAYAGDVFLWIPKLKRFVQSQTLSQDGEISKSKRKGCVIVETKCSSTSWWTREICFNQATGRWKVVSDNNCPEQLP